ncbi:hypothetical protein HanPSC8_Chr02g0052291 [Helianthus annuus]|nr:hypothetical protein HanPSC8_Chr02g0052291 [Helianthus annuus]
MTAPFIRFLNLFPCVNLQGIANATTVSILDPFLRFITFGMQYMYFKSNAQTY